MLKQISVAGDASAGGIRDDSRHGDGGNHLARHGHCRTGRPATSASRILPVNVYDSSATTTSWNVALGMQAAVNGGATVLNLSLGGSDDSGVLDTWFNRPSVTAFRFLPRPATNPLPRRPIRRRFPASMAVTAVDRGLIASYANYGNFMDLGLPGNTVVYFGSQPWLVQGTSVSTAYMTGIAAGTKTATGQSWSQIEAP